MGADPPSPDDLASWSGELAIADPVTTILTALVGPLLLLVLVLANAFFVLGEFALITVERGRVERLAEAGNRRARSALLALQQLTLQLSAAQLGITLTSLLVGFIAEPTLAGWSAGGGELPYWPS